MKIHTLLTAVALILSADASQDLRAETPAGSSQARLYPISELDAAPVAIETAPPRYPAELRDQKIRGEAVISLVVEANGEVSKVAEVRSTHPAFTQSAISAVSQWRFKPGTKDGKSVACQLHVPIVFELK